MASQHRRYHQYSYGGYWDLSESYPSCCRSHHTPNEYIQMLEAERDVLKRRMKELEQELEELRQQVRSVQA